MRLYYLVMPENLWIEKKYIYGRLYVEVEIRYQKLFNTCKLTLVEIKVNK